MRGTQIVLIVEDEKINRKILKKMLSDNYKVLEAENGEMAWKIIQERRKELSAVLLDLIMPVMSGRELLGKIKEARIEELPIIVATGYADEKIEQETLEEGAWDFVLKPYNATILLSRLKNAIARSKIAAFEKIRYMAEHDELTGFYNRSRLFMEIGKMIKAHPEMKFVMMRFDIDHFAIFNSSFGEKEGDRLLKYMAGHIQEEALKRPLTLYGRITADVFCICGTFFEENTNVQEKVEMTQKWLAAFKNDYRIEISVGACLIDDSNVSVEEYYYRTSLASQMCKNQIDTHITFYDNRIGEKLAEEIVITNEMQTALDEQQFVVYLQPKFSIPSENASGAEALVRWMHPEKGMISPGVFIPVFEKNGFIAKLDYYVWDKTCEMINRWTKEGKTPFPVSVNISRVSLYNPHLSDMMIELVHKHQISPSLLQLEITESAYMTNPGLMEQTIDLLHEAGFTILMDDFGSGYSSLNTLKRIKVDVLKIDMKFLPVHDEVERGEIILSSIIKMAKWLGMSVTVEGVETRHQRDFLEGVGCDSIQGYYYSRPIPSQEYEEKYLRELAPSSCNQKIASPKHNATILIIDDSEMDAAILKENLCNMYHVEIVNSAEAGLAYLNQNAGHVRLILVDNQMEHMSGMEFLKHCGRDSVLKDIPKIMITANDTVEDQIESYNAGAYDYITKPFITEIVAARVKHVMEYSYRTSVFDTLEQEYSKVGELDSATLLLNKIAFRKFSSEVMESNPDEQEALMVMDIDDFKKINDQYGHIMGDRVIKCVAEVLTNAFRKTDVIGRFGGDEFVVMMTKLPSPEMARRKAAEIIRETMIRCSKNLNLEVSISVGISYSKQGDTIDTLFARADQALYYVKSTGKGRAAVYGETVPDVSDDTKPIVLVCTWNPQMYPAIALAYGNDASFINISSFQELINAFKRYGNRIKVACLDMERKIMEDSDEFYQYIMNKNENKIYLIAVCQEGRMAELKCALALDVFDIITMPLQIDTVQRRISRALMNVEMENK